MIAVQVNEELEKIPDSKIVDIKFQVDAEGSVYVMIVKK